MSGYPKDKKSAYLQGYQNISPDDEGIIKGGGGPWKADWETLGKKIPYVYSEDRTRQSIMHTDSEQLFKYSLNNVNTMFEDPTFLGFSLKFDKGNSALWNYGLGNDTDYKSTALSFIRKYKTISEIAKREPIYINFLQGLDEIFPEMSNSAWKKSYYIETIKGLDKLSSKMVDYDKDRISITLTEDVTLRTSYLAELYNNLTYSYKNQRHLIPDNCLRFDLMIEITDIRIFNIVNESGSTINTDPPRIIYTLHDCNFDFSKSLVFPESITTAGYGGGNSDIASLIFDIKYKSISKEFRSSLISGSVSLHNKLAILVNNKILTKNQFFQYDVKTNSLLKEQQKYSSSEGILPATIDGNTVSTQSNSLPNNIDVNATAGNTTNNVLENLKPSLKDKAGEWLNGIGDSLKQTVIDGTTNYIDDLKGKYNEIRGELLKETLRQIRTPKVLPRIYPENVYAVDFRTLSLESFAQSLASGAANDLEKGITDGLLGATKI